MIKAIAFDYGGVLTVGRHTERVLKLMETMCGIAIGEKYDDIDSIIIEFDSGKMRPQEFVEKINKKLGLAISLQEMKILFKQAVNLNPKVIALVQELREKYRILMLSNNDPITVEVLRAKHQDLLELFEKTYFSCELKMRKPNRHIFEFMLKDSGLKPKECVFTDDKEKNVKAAEKLGVKGILFKDAERLEETLTKILNI